MQLGRHNVLHVSGEWHIGEEAGWCPGWGEGKGRSVYRMQQGRHPAYMFVGEKRKCMPITGSKRHLLLAWIWEGTTKWANKGVRKVVQCGWGRSQTQLLTTTVSTSGSHTSTKVA